MKMAIIEKYREGGQGYHPFLIRAGWQVAQLNHLPEQDLFGIAKMDKHFLTDEVFILVKGTAVLIAAREVGEGSREGAPGDTGGRFIFECVRLERGTVYNIPAGQWHNIAMSRDAELFIVEKNDTHKGDFEFRQLTEDQKKQLNSQLGSLLI